MNKVSNTEKSTIKEFISNGIWAFKELFRIAFWDTLLTFVVTFILGLIPTISSYIYSRSLDELLKQVTNGISIGKFLMFDQLFIQLILLSTLISIIGYSLNRLDVYLRYKFSTIHFQNYDAELMLKIASYDIKTFEDKEYADLIKKGQNNLWKIRGFVTSTLRILTNLTNVVISGYIIFQSSSLLFLFLLVAGLPSGIISFIYAKRWFDLEDDLMESYRKKGSLGSNIVSEEKIPQNRVLDSSKFIFEKFDSIKNFIFKKEITLQQKQEMNYFVANIPFFIGGKLSYLYFAIQLLLGKISLGQLNFLSSRADAFSSRLDNVLNDISELFQNGLYLKTVRKLFNINPDIKSGHIKINSKNPPKIEFRNVHFRYPKTKKEVFNGFNLTINPGDEIAIVGENGAGKTTLIKLLLRLYEVDKGDILINEVNLKDIDLDSYYKLFGVLFQEYSFYNSLSIKENIIIPDLNIDKEKYSIALKQSQAGKFIKKLEERDDSILNKSFKGGVTLSTGQYQKLGLARVFYKNSPVLILDEPTASIDPVSEYKIFKKVYQFIKKKSLIIISHRFSTVRNAKKIYVFDKGKIIEEGSHSELMKRNGVYADAFNKQAEGYTKVD